MKIFRKYIFPGLFGLMVYFTIRLLHDIAVDSQFWKRDWALNIFEMCCSLVFGYAAINLYRRLFQLYDRRSPMKPNYQSVVRELIILIISNLVLVNLILMPMAAFTDDGLSWADFTEITLIPTLYAIIYYGIARSSIWLRGYVDNKVQLEKLTNDHLETELKFLKSQYHPHFLFNALNTIYFQMDEDISGAKKSIEKFSELLRYQLYDMQQQVPVGQEIDYLRSYIELQKLRCTDKLKLSVHFDDQLNHQLIHPLLFLPLVENAFKFIGGDYLMLIKTDLDDGYLKFTIENSVPTEMQCKIRTGGIGLENLKRRLNLLYPGRHILILENGNALFKAQLKLLYEQ